MIFLKVYPSCTPFTLFVLFYKKQVTQTYVHSFMLLKASKSILTVFKQYFRENPSKQVCLADFATPKKRTSFTTYFSKANFRRKKNVRFLLRSLYLTKWTFFSIGPIWMIFMEGRVNTCYFLDFEKFWQKKGKKGYYGL